MFGLRRFARLSRPLGQVTKARLFHASPLLTQTRVSLPLNNKLRFSSSDGDSSHSGRFNFRTLGVAAALAACAAAGVTVAYCKEEMKYVILAAPGQEEFAQRMAKEYPERFSYYPSKWDKFPDGTDKICLGGFYPENHISGSNLLFLASLANNDIAMSQFHALTMLCESFPRTVTIVLPFLPQATMERVTREGTVATANTTAKLFSYLPTVGRPIRVMLYDLHTLQNRFYFHSNAIATLHTTFPLLIEQMQNPVNGIDCVCFPDDGAEKRYGKLFKAAFPHIETITCGKKRHEDDPLKRSVVIKDGKARGLHPVIVDDLVRSGGTLFETAKLLKNEGATDVSAFVAHAVFPGQSWKSFVKGGHRNIFKNFWISNSVSHVVNEIPDDDCFTKLDILPLIVNDL